MLICLVSAYWVPAAHQALWSVWETRDWWEPWLWLATEPTGPSIIRAHLPSAVPLPAHPGICESKVTSAELVMDHMCLAEALEVCLGGRLQPTNASWALIFKQWPKVYLSRGFCFQIRGCLYFCYVISGSPLLFFKLRTGRLWLAGAVCPGRGKTQYSILSLDSKPPGCEISRCLQKLLFTFR